MAMRLVSAKHSRKTWPMELKHFVRYAKLLDGELSYLVNRETADALSATVVWPASGPRQRDPALCFSVRILMRLSLSVGVTWQALLQQIGLTTVRRGKDEISLHQIGQHENILCSVTAFALIGRALRKVRGADAQGSAYDDPYLYVTYNPAEKNAPHYPVQIAEYRRLLHKQLGWDDKKEDARPTKPVKQTRRTKGSVPTDGVFVSSTDSRKSAAHGVGNVGSVGGCVVVAH